MARLMMHRQILKTFHKLPSKVQKRVSELIDEFQRDPNSPDIGLHPLKETALDPKVRSITKLPDGYRAIVIAPEKGDTYLLVHIDSHDKAYDWVRNKRFEVHEMTGVFQVFDTEEVKTALAADLGPTTVTYPLNQLSDDELFSAGVPRPLIPAIRSIHSDDDLDSLSTYLPPDCRDVLFGLAAGLSLDEALHEMLGTDEETKPPTPAGPGDFSQLDQAPRFDLIQVTSEDEFKELLQAKLADRLEEWRIFLHPYQRKLVRWQTKGPMNINGAAGTGKTVALMHRAVHLAETMTTPRGRVLVSTFTTNLSVTIRHLIDRLNPKVAERIEVTNLHALARAICIRAGWKGRIADEHEIDAIWKDVWSDSTLGELPLPADELRREYDQVIDPNGIDDEDSYLTTVRSGRPRISREQRRAAWTVFRLFQRGLKTRNLLTFEGAIHQARLAAEQGKFTHYDHVLVDEIQDFSLEALRLIRAISPIEAGTPDPLCVVGDGHQRIYRGKVPLSRAGIDIRGRSRRLKINYRTSEQIRRFAQGILQGVDIDDLDDGVVSTVGDHSVFRGPAPTIQRCSSEAAEAQAIVTWVKSLLDQGLASHEICITPRRESLISALKNANIGVFELKPNADDPGGAEDGVRIGTMQRIKGLEFRAVGLACANSDDALNHLESADLRQRCERYVAATRAREYLLVVLH